MTAPWSALAARVEEACAKATPGPWVIRAGEEVDGIVRSSRFDHALSIGQMYHRPEADAAFIALSREALPAAVARIRELEAERAALLAVAIIAKKLCDRMGDAPITDVLNAYLSALPGSLRAEIEGA